MLRRTRICCCAALALAQLLIPRALVADEVILRGGGRVEGLIVEESATTVVIDTVIGRIRSTVEFPMSQVAEIIRGPLPDGFFERTDEPGVPPQTPPSTPESDAATYFLEIPLVGVFGEDFDETGLRDALAFARQRGVQTILLILDSKGGETETTERLVRILDEHLDWFSYHCRIKQALGDAMWVVARCHHIYVDPGSVMGAAVLAAPDPLFRADPDAAANGVRATELVAAAQRTRVLPAPLVRAMVLRGSECYALKRDDGGWSFSDAPPPAGAPARPLHSPQMVLTLTGEQLAEFGLAQLWNERTTLHPDSTKLLNRYGEAAMRRSRDRVQDLARAGEQVNALPELLRQARTARRPDQFSDYQYEYTHSRSGLRSSSTRRLTPDSAALWARRETAYRAVWQSVTDHCQSIQRTFNKHRHDPLPGWTAAAIQTVEAAKSEADRNRR